MDLVKLEEDVLAFWRQEKVFEHSVRARQGKPARLAGPLRRIEASRRAFVFYEGPPSANAKPGIHHVLARAFKDLIPRFKTMQGYLVLRRAGWDTHGLPIEVQAEKELGLKSKKDIEAYGVAKFNDFCRKLVFRYQKDWEELTERIGFWIDLKHPYITYENEYIEKLWGIIKQFHDKKLLYKGHKVVPHCPRCGTSLSSHEVALGYEDVTEPAIYVRFRVKPKTKDWEKTSILAWTTTPWTLPGNVALAVNVEADYICVKDPQIEGHHLVLAKQLVDRLKLSTEGAEIFKGSEMVGIEYEPLFDIKQLQSPNSYKVYEANFVTLEEGTGVVHTAVMYGQDDYELGEKVGLPKVHTVAEDGTFKDFVKPFAGMFVKDADRKIIDDLKKRDLLLKQENYTHSYPFCWRCGTPLLYYAKDSWFVRMSSLREELLANNAKITWVPEHLRDGRFGEFLREAKDWAFSRERYWGTPLPVWSCEQGHYRVIGSAKELPKKLADLHRPFIDEITLKCSECREMMKREPYVVDVWFDSGAMPYASGEKEADRFPADFIAEAIDQTRGWFYTLLAVSTALGDGPSYKTVISTGHVLDAKGQKMSKSKGNVIDPKEIIDRHGSDALRWYFYAMNQSGDNKSFIEKDLITYKNKTLGLLWNIYNYYETYKTNSKLKTQNSKLNPKFQMLDRWITSKLHETTKRVTQNLENYRVTEAARAIMLLIDDTSTWYLRRSRGRTDQAFFATLRSVLQTIATLLAPFVPFSSEALHRRFEKGSVHLKNWPKPDKELIDLKLISEMAAARALVRDALKLRAQAGMKIRQPLGQLTVTGKQLPGELAALIADEVNVKNIVKGRKLALDTTLTPELKQEGIMRDVVRQIQDLRKKAGYRFSDRVKVYYELSDKTLASALKNRKATIERETGSSLSQGIPARFDEKLEGEGIALAIARR